MTMGKARAVTGWPSSSVLMAPMSHIPRNAQTLEGVLRIMVHGAAGALGRADGLQLRHDGVDVRGRAVDREGDADLAQRTVALALAREIERHDRNALALDVAPD